jgi:S1-C subfamily serine protease
MTKTFCLCCLSAVLGGVLCLIATGLLATGNGLNEAAAAPAPVQSAPPAPPGPFAPYRVSGPPAALNAAAPNAAAPDNRPLSDLEELTPEERVNVAVYEKANRGVVNIAAQGYRGDRFLMMELPSSGEGSGAVIDRQGHIVTNWHVVEGARQIEVTLFNGKSYDARLVGRAATDDVAVIRIQAPPEELFPVVFGDSSRLRVGQRVFALGNPFGLERTLSTGIISSMDRRIRRRAGDRRPQQIIQIDASINPGNSGGPLLDSHARMIGMNFAIASKSGESAGVGFAIPINTISRVVPLLIQYGKVTRPDIGITQVVQTDKGLRIESLVSGGPAEKAGLQGPRRVRQQRRQGPFIYQYSTLDRAAADVIVALEGKPLKTADEFLNILDGKRPGDVAVVRIIRAGREMDVPVRLEAGEE